MIDGMPSTARQVLDAGGRLADTAALLAVGAVLRALEVPASLYGRLRHPAGR